MEEAFKKIVDHIFNNWTALKLTVEHGLEGHVDSQQIIVDFKTYIVQYCLYESNIQAENIEEAIEDIMDQEFDTICDDNSPKEIANILFKFVKLLKEGNFAQCEVEFNNLPTNKNQLSILQSSTEVLTQSTEKSADIERPETSNVDITMEADSGWTEVRTRRRK